MGTSKAHYTDGHLPPAVDPARADRIRKRDKDRLDRMEARSKDLQLRFRLQRRAIDMKRKQEREKKIADALVK